MQESYLEEVKKHDRVTQLLNSLTKRHSETLADLDEAKERVKSLKRECHRKRA